MKGGKRRSRVIGREHIEKERVWREKGDMQRRNEHMQIDVHYRGTEGDGEGSRWTGGKAERSE